MNRLQIRSAAPAASLSGERFTSRLATVDSEVGYLPCSVFTPLHYESGYAYPLIVWLHDDNEDEQSIRRMLPKISMRNYLGVGVRGTRLVTDGDPFAGDEFATDEFGSETDGYSWCQTLDHTFLAEHRVLEAVELMSERFNVCPDRVFLAGRGSGGTMAFRIAMRQPDRFAGVISLGGGFPQDDAPLARLVEARRVPVFVAAASDDEAYPSSDCCDDLRLLHAAGMSVTLRYYPQKHRYLGQILGDVDRWIMELIAASGQMSVVPSEQSGS
ncbi:MAG: hypothetical protein DWQ31_10940 [Planctomycetota bacterium]|nr:MAG: hypothetical protein DWQ31_10940 [Planctomycetota bacterium]REJ94397.1 MAG: hypothetical protein DWQ35_08340 [Planctomycetota bacterium]REK22070.1 MAG: hypothetical protein DWQ42_18185 [Planctomycetota bacterium]REK44478.1 MAG: hypothetical protein DWQ46_09470 [Planctomycetota bacterium]